MFLAWLLGCFDAPWKMSAGLLGYARRGVFVVLYIAYIWGFAVVLQKLLKRLGTPWVFSN